MGMPGTCTLLELFWAGFPLFGRFIREPPSLAVSFASLNALVSRFHVGLAIPPIITLLACSGCRAARFLRAVGRDGFCRHCASPADCALLLDFRSRGPS